MVALMGTVCMTGCGNGNNEAVNNTVEESTQVDTEESVGTEEVADTATEENTADEVDADQAAADNVAALIDAIYVQERTDETDKQCADAKAACGTNAGNQSKECRGVSFDAGGKSGVDLRI